MFYRKQYFSQEEREDLLLKNNDLILVEEQNITEGNFLVFSDVEVEKPINLEEMQAKTLLNTEVLLAMKNIVM